MTGHKSSVFKFGEVVVREGEFLIIRESEAVPVEPKAFRVLLYLLQNRGRVVTKEEIVESVWDDCAVSDNSLTRSIATLRRLLRDDTREPRYIGTVPTVGYRLLCAVEVTEVGTVYGPVDEDLEMADGAGQSSMSSGAPRQVLTSAKTVEIVGGSGSRRGSRLAIGVAVAAAVILGAVAVVLVMHRLRSPFPTYAAESRLTANFEDAPVTSSSISPDARVLAFTDRSGLFVRQLEGGETNRVSTPQSLGPVRVESWFPDGAHLLVSSWDGRPHDPQSLYKVSVAGESARKLVEDGEYARVSPDGVFIAFSRVAEGRSAIWIMRPDSGEAFSVLAGSANDEEYLSAVAWAPNSQRFACVRTTVHQDGGVDRKIETVDVTSRKVSLVLSDPRVMPALAWTAQDTLVFSRFDDAPNQKDLNLWQAQLDARTDKPVAVSRVTSGHGFIVELSAANGGKALALRRVEPQNDVYLAKLQHGKLIGAPTRLTLENWEDHVYSWTPDGEALLFTSDRDGHQHIYKQVANQTQPDLLVGGHNDVGVPRLGPQGNEMLYLQFPAEGEAARDVQIRTIPLSGGTSRLVLQAPAIWNLQCGLPPSTTCIYSSGANKELRFYFFESKTGSKAELSSSKFRDTFWSNWSLSPDGRYLAGYKPGVRQDAAIRIISLKDESEKTILLQGWIGLNGMDWAADGKSFWVSACTQYSSQWGAPNTCTLVDADLSGRITPLMDGREIHLFAAIPSPRGDQLALAGETAANSNVWIVRSSE